MSAAPRPPGPGQAAGPAGRGFLARRWRAEGRSTTRARGQLEELRGWGSLTALGEGHPRGLWQGKV